MEPDPFTLATRFKDQHDAYGDSSVAPYAIRIENQIEALSKAIKSHNVELPTADLGIVRSFLILEDPTDPRLRFHLPSEELGKDVVREDFGNEIRAVPGFGRLVPVGLEWIPRGVACKIHFQIMDHLSSSQGADDPLGIERGGFGLGVINDRLNPNPQRKNEYQPNSQILDPTLELAALQLSAVVMKRSEAFVDDNARVSQSPSDYLISGYKKGKHGEEFSSPVGHLLEAGTLVTIEVVPEMPVGPEIRFTFHHSIFENAHEQVVHSEKRGARIGSERVRKGSARAPSTGYKFVFYTGTRANQSQEPDFQLWYLCQFWKGVKILGLEY